SARHDEARRLAYAVGFGDYAEGVRALRTLEDGALLRRDFDMAALARHCLDHLIRAHPGIPVPIALGDADASACEPTDARGLLLALLVYAGVVLSAFVGWHVGVHLRLRWATPPAGPGAR